jgi:hypothetical protein
MLSRDVVAKGQLRSHTCGHEILPVRTPSRRDESPRRLLPSSIHMTTFSTGLRGSVDQITQILPGRLPAKVGPTKPSLFLVVGDQQNLPALQDGLKAA